MGSFITGALSGYSGMAGRMREKGTKGIFRRGPKRPQPTGNIRKYDPNTGQVGPVEIPQYKKGGKVRRTGLAKLHKGERVLTKKQARRYRGSKRR